MVDGVSGRPQFDDGPAMLPSDVSGVARQTIMIAVQEVRGNKLNTPRSVHYLQRQCIATIISFFVFVFVIFIFAFFAGVAFFARYLAVSSEKVCCLYTVRECLVQYKPST